MAFEKPVSSFFLSHRASKNKSLGELIKKIRTTNNLTQAAFGKLFEPSVTQSTIARWEKGVQTPDKIHFPKIASLLNISFEELLKIVEEPLFNEDDFYSGIENKTMTHNKRHLAMLKKGVTAWNKWREKNPHVIPQLSGIDICLGKYSGLDGYNLNDANLAGFKGKVVSFDRASLRRANLEKASFNECGFEGTDLTEANLKKIDINSCSLNRAILRRANLSEASIRYSTAIKADLEESEIAEAEFISLDMSRAIFKKSKISHTKLININLNEANFNEAFINKTTIKECSIYGASFLQTNFNDVDNQGAYVSPSKCQGLSINSLALSQFIYMQRYNRSEIKKFVEQLNLEEEIIELGSILAEKYGEYSHTENFYIFNNRMELNDINLPYIDIRKHNNYFQIDFHPNYSIENLLSKKDKHRRILQIIDDTIESNFEIEDVEYIRQLVELNQDVQYSMAENFLSLALEILEIKEENEFVSKNYTLRRENKEIVLYSSSDWKIELARIINSGSKLEIIRSSLTKKHIINLQRELDNLKR